jgi:Cu/Ag efflux protein CusF
MRAANLTVGVVLVVAAILGTLPASAESATATGQVRKIDAAASKITIRHGPIATLGMPDPMTMVYRVKDPAVLGALSVGDRVEFDVDHGTSGYVITHIVKK